MKHAYPYYILIVIQVLSVVIALSTLGNVLAVMFTQGRRESDFSCG